MSVKIVSVSDLRRNVSQTIKKLREKNEAIYITQHGRPQAVLVSYEHYEQLMEQARQQSTVKVAAETIRSDPALRALVEQIKTAPPNPAAFRPATGSLAEALQNSPTDPDFDLESWTRQWEAIEAEIKTIDKADDMAEGRG